MSSNLKDLVKKFGLYFEKIKYGDRSELVYQVKFMLKHLGYFKGDLNYSYDNSLKDAIIDYKINQNGFVNLTEEEIERLYLIFKEDILFKENGSLKIETPIKKNVKYNKIYEIPRMYSFDKSESYSSRNNNEIDTLIFNVTGCLFNENKKKILKSNNSAHYYILSDGTIIRSIPEKFAAKILTGSEIEPLEYLEERSLIIELENFGELEAEFIGEKYSYLSKKYPDQIFDKENGLSDPIFDDIEGNCWQPYEEKQIESLIAFLTLKKEQYNFDKIIYANELSSEYTGPGYLFPLKEIIECLASWEKA